MKKNKAEIKIQETNKRGEREKIIIEPGKLLAKRRFPCHTDSLFDEILSI